MENLKASTMDSMKAALKEIEMDCQTEYPSVSRSARLKDCYVAARMAER